MKIEEVYLYMKRNNLIDGYGYSAESLDATQKYLKQFLQPDEDILTAVCAKAKHPDLKVPFLVIGGYGYLILFTDRRVILGLKTKLGFTKRFLEFKYEDLDLLSMDFVDEMMKDDNGEISIKTKNGNLCFWIHDRAYYSDYSLINTCKPDDPEGLAAVSFSLCQKGALVTKSVFAPRLILCAVQYFKKKLDKNSKEYQELLGYEKVYQDNYEKRNDLLKGQHLIMPWAKYLGLEKFKELFWIGYKQIIEREPGIEEYLKKIDEKASVVERLYVRDYIPL